MPSTVLLFVFGDLGDTILTVPAIRVLRRQLPNARLILLAKPVAAGFIRDLDLVDEVIPVEKHVFDRVTGLLRPQALWPLWQLTRRLRREHVDTVVLFHHLVTRWGATKFALLVLASGAKRRIGLDNGRGWFLTESIPDRGFGARHEAEYYMDIVGLLGACGPLELEAPRSQADHECAIELLDSALSFDGPLLAIHPGTGWYGPGRRWAADRFALVAELVREKIDIRCVLVGTDHERTAATEVAALLGHAPVDLVGKTSVGVLGAVLQRCAVLVANDGGVGHLAAAVGTPVVSIFGPSNDRAWRPLTATVIAADLPCRPCFYRDHERGLPDGCTTRECLDQVSPADVAAAVLSILSARVPGS